MITKLKNWSDTKKLPTATVLDNLYKWLLTEATPAFIDTCCKKIVNKGNLSQNDWTCSKNPSKGGQAFDVTKYSCNTMKPPADLRK